MNWKIGLIAGIVILLLAIILTLPHSDSALGLSISQLGNSIKFENIGTPTCVVFLTYSGGAHERIVLGAGQTEFLFNRPEPIEISAVCK